MTILKLNVAETNFERITDYLYRSYQFDYENLTTDIAVMVGEEFYYRTMSSQANMIILKKAAGAILIDIIGCGGGDGLFNIAFGSEDSFTRKVEKTVLAYATAFGLHAGTDTSNASVL